MLQKRPFTAIGIFSGTLVAINFLLFDKANPELGAVIMLFICVLTGVAVGQASLDD